MNTLSWIAYWSTCLWWFTRAKQNCAACLHWYALRFSILAVNRMPDLLKWHEKWNPPVLEHKCKAKCYACWYEQNISCTESHGIHNQWKGAEMSSIVIFLDIVDLQLLLLTKWFFIHISILHDNISLQKCWDVEYTKVGMDEQKVSWDDNTWKLIQKRC
jgi:hypothetical protein